MSGMEERHPLPSLGRGASLHLEHHQLTMRWAFLKQKSCLRRWLTEGWAWLVQGVFLPSVICSQVSCQRAAVCIPERVCAVGALCAGHQRPLNLSAQSQSPWEIEFVFSGSGAGAQAVISTAYCCLGILGPHTQVPSLLGTCGFVHLILGKTPKPKGLEMQAKLHAEVHQAASFIWAHFHW